MAEPPTFGEKDKHIGAGAEDRMGRDALQKELQLRAADAHLLAGGVVALTIAARQGGHLSRRPHNTVSLEGRASCVCGHEQWVMSRQTRVAAVFA